jgi:hypothetical protein
MDTEDMRGEQVHAIHRHYNINVKEGNMSKFLMLKSARNP